MGVMRIPSITPTVGSLLVLTQRPTLYQKCISLGRQETHTCLATGALEVFWHCCAELQIIRIPQLSTKQFLGGKEWRQPCPCPLQQDTSAGVLQVKHSGGIYPEDGHLSETYILNQLHLWLGGKEVEACSTSMQISCVMVTCRQTSLWGLDAVCIMRHQLSQVPCVDINNEAALNIAWLPKRQWMPETPADGKL